VCVCIFLSNIKLKCVTVKKKQCDDLKNMFYGVSEMYIFFYVLHFLNLNNSDLISMNIYYFSFYLTILNFCSENLNFV